MKHETSLDLQLSVLSVDLAFIFSLEFQIQPVFLQPKYLIVLGGDVNAAATGATGPAATAPAVAVYQYGFVTDDLMGMHGAKPEEKRAGWMARLEVYHRGDSKREGKYTMYGDGSIDFFGEKMTVDLLLEDVRNLTAVGGYPV